MNAMQEKRLLLRAIQQLQQIVNQPDASLEALERYHNLVNCLIALSWTECNQRGQSSNAKKKGNTMIRISMALLGVVVVFFVGRAIKTIIVDGAFSPQVIEKVIGDECVKRNCQFKQFGQW